MTGKIKWNNVQVASINFWPTDSYQSVVFKGDFGIVKLMNLLYLHTSSGLPYYTLRMQFIGADNKSVVVTGTRTSTYADGHQEVEQISRVTYNVEEPQMGTGFNSKDIVDATISITGPATPTEKPFWRNSNGTPQLVVDDDRNWVRDA